MPNVASDIKIASPITPRNQSRQPDQADDNPFAAILDEVAPEKPAAKSDRTAPAKESRKSDPSDPRAPQDDPAPASDPAVKEPAPASGEEPAVAAEAKAETETVEAAPPATDPAEADLAAIIDATLVTPATQPVQAAPVIVAPALAPVDVAPVETAEAIAAIAAATATIPAKAIAAPATTDTDETASDTKDAPKIAAPSGDQADVIDPNQALAAKQANTINAKSGEQHAASPEVDGANAQPTTAKAEPAADASLKAAQPAATAPDNTPTFTLSSLQAHATAQTAPAQPATQLANAVPVSGVAFEIAAQAKAGGTRFEIRLDPQELGRIDVRLEIDKNGQVTSHLRVERAETLDMLRRDSANLERALQDAGLKTSDNALNFSLRDQSQQQTREQNTPSSQLYIATDDSMSAVGGTQVSAWASRLGGIDIRV